MVSMKENAADLPSTVTCNEALKTLGQFGCYQRRVFFLMCLVNSSCGIQALMTVFTLATPDFRCALPEFENDTFSSSGLNHEEMLNVSIPWETDDDDNPVRSKCLLYRNRNQNQSAPPGELLSNRSTISCHKWVYDHSFFISTFTEKANLVCAKKADHAYADMIYMVGMLVGSVIMGLISDRFGRKVALLLALLIHVGGAVGIAFSPSFIVFVVLRFFIGVSHTGALLTAYILGLEMVGDSMRTMAGCLFQVFWPLALFLQTGAAYWLREWNRLQLAMSCPTVLFLTYYCLVSESPRWLSSKGMYDKANAILTHVAKVNGLPPPPKVGQTVEEVKPKESALRMFTHRTTLVRTMIVFFNWVVLTMVYYGISLNVGNIGGDIYLNFFLSAVAELVGNVLPVLGLDRLGRKKMHCGSMILGGLACVVTIFPVKYGGSSKQWSILLLSNLGKLGVVSGFNVIFLFSAELFPTVARNSLFGASSMVSRLGGIASPYIAQLNVIVGGDLGVALPLVVFGGSALAAGLLALLLPETLHRSLPETVEDAINFGTQSRNRSESREYICPKPHVEGDSSSVDNPRSA